MEQKQNTTMAINFLSGTLGKHFLKHVGPEHYIFKKLIEGKNEGVWGLAQTIKHFREKQPDFDEVVMPLIRSVRKFQEEALPFLEIGGSYTATGFDVKFLKEIQSGSTPDIELVHQETKQKVFIEVSQVRERQERVDIGKFFQRMMIALNDKPHIPYGGRLIVALDEDQEAGLKANIEEIKKRAYLERKFLTIENEYAVLGFAHETHISPLESWLKEKGCMMNSIIGPSLEVNETSRITGFKISDKASQLPNDQPGLIYLTVRPEHFLTNEIADLKFIEAVRTKLAKHSQVLGLVVYAKIDADVEYPAIIYRGLNCHVVKMSCDEVRLDLLFVFNDRCKIPILPGTLDSLYSALSLFRVL